MMAVLAVVLIAIATTVWSQKGQAVTSHLTIYVGPKLVREGGVVIISALPLPRDEWEKLPDTDALAMWDKANGKHQQVKAEDKHFGIIIDNQATAVELYYPDDGTYTFNLLKTPSDTAILTTKRTGVGSGSMMPDPQTGGHMEWPSMSTIEIVGSAGGVNTSEELESQFFDLTGPDNSTYYRVNGYSAGRIITITDAGLVKLREGSTND
jgi:hypothetical protein